MPSQVETGLTAAGVAPAAARRFFEEAIGRDAARARMRDAFHKVPGSHDMDGGDEEGRPTSRNAGGEAAALVESRRVGVEEVAGVIAQGGEWAFLSDPDPRTKVCSRAPVPSIFAGPIAPASCVCVPARTMFVAPFRRPPRRPLSDRLSTNPTSPVLHARVRLLNIARLCAVGPLFLGAGTAACHLTTRPQLLGVDLIKESG